MGTSLTEHDTWLQPPLRRREWHMRKNSVLALPRESSDDCGQALLSLVNQRCWCLPASCCQGFYVINVSKPCCVWWLLCGYTMGLSLFSECSRTTLGVIIKIIRLCYQLMKRFPSQYCYHLVGKLVCPQLCSSSYKMHVIHRHLWHVCVTLLWNFLSSLVDTVMSNI